MKRLSALLSLMTLAVFFAGAPVGSGYGVGDTVADFKLKNTDGKMVALSDFSSSKGVILIFDCNTCPFSKAYNDRIIGLHKKYASSGFPVVAVNANDPEVSPGDSYDQMVAMAKSKGYDFPYLVDESQKVAKAFGATNTPHAFILKRDGAQFKVAYIGAIDNNARDASSADKKYVEEAVEALLKGNTPETTKTKAVGCGIKWKNA
jgi:peroxiredoxin